MRLLLWLFALSFTNCMGQQAIPKMPVQQPAARSGFSLLDSSYAVQDIIVDFQSSSKAIITATPPSVKQKIIDDVYKYIHTELTSDSDFVLKAVNALENIILLRLPVSDTVSAYVFHINEALAFGNRYFIYLSSKGGSLSPKPFMYYGDMMQDGEESFGMNSRLPVRPHYGLYDIDMDGQQELMVEERRHAGNIYDALVAHYLHYDNQLRLTETIKIETWATLPFEVTDRRIRRTLGYDKAAKEYIVNAVVNGKKGQQEIGVAHLKRAAASWRVVHKKTAPATTYSSLLITCHPEGTNNFLLGSGEN